MKITTPVLYIIFILSSLAMACSGDSSDDSDETSYTISGNISGEDFEGVGVAFSEDPPSTSSELPFTLTDQAGNYEILLRPGTYRVSPSKEGLAFSPTSQTVNVVSSDIGDIDFVASISENEETEFTFGGKSFTIFNGAVFNATAEGDNDLRLDLTQNAIWYHNGQAGLIYTEVTGDFTISAEVSAQKSSNNSEPTSCDVCLGGLMARNPSNTDGENYVHIVVGVNPDGQGVETKNTTDGISEFTPTIDGTTSYEVQMEREGASFTLSKRSIGSPEWVLATTYERTDLPETLQVGMNIYTSVSGGTVADLSVLFEDIVLQTEE